MFSSIILNNSVAVLVAVCAAKRAGKGNVAAPGELVEYCLCFFIQSTDNTNIKKLGAVFHSSSLLHYNLSQEKRGQWYNCFRHDTSPLPWQGDDLVSSKVYLMTRRIVHFSQGTSSRFCLS